MTSAKDPTASHEVRRSSTTASSMRRRRAATAWTRAALTAPRWAGRRGFCVRRANRLQARFFVACFTNDLRAALMRVW